MGTLLNRPQAPSNPYGNRWRWWYAAISDRMIAHPDWTQDQIAKDLGKSPTTISMIVSTDLFKSHFALRRQQWQEVHDQSLREKLTHVATKSLDLLTTQMEKKGDMLPIQRTHEIAMGALDRLGFAPKAGPSVVVQNNTQNNMVAPSASVDALLEAREALRKVEQLRASTPSRQLPKSREIDALFAESGLEPDGGDAPVTQGVVIDNEDAGDFVLGDGDDIPVPSKR